MPNISAILAADDFENSALAVVYYNTLNELVTTRLGEGSSSKGTLSEQRIALWVAWEAHRVANVLEDDNAQKIDLLTMVGLPKKQKDFAALLGVNPRTLRGYAEKYGQYVSTARETAVERVLARYDHLALHALGLSAATPDHRHASDRRTFFTMRGFLVERSDVTSGGEKVEAPTIYLPDNGRISGLPTDEEPADE